MKTMYDILNMKAKNSIFKSVFITDRKDYFGNLIIEVEPYDDTFLNAISCVSKYDKTMERIIKKVYKLYNSQTINLTFYTDYGHTELLVNENLMKRWELI